MDFYVEKVIKYDGTTSFVLVDRNYKIVEEVALFLNYLEMKGMSINTIEGYCRDLKTYYTWLNEMNIKFYEVTSRMLISWIDFIKNETKNKKKLSARTINRQIATISSYYNYFEGMGEYVKDNPIITKTKNSNFKSITPNTSRIDTNLFRQKETKTSKERRLFRNEIELLYSYISTLYKNEAVNVRNKLLFKLLYETGFRIGETLGLRVTDYSEPNPNEEIGFISVKKHPDQYHKDHNIKTEMRTVPIRMQLIYEIDDYVINFRPFKEDVTTIFVSHSSSNSGDFLTRSAVNKIFERLSEKYGDYCTPHTLRHTHGTELEENGYDSVFISDRMGHRSIESTNKYIHPSHESQVRAYEQMMLFRKEANLE